MEALQQQQQQHPQQHHRPSPRPALPGPGSAIATTAGTLPSHTGLDGGSGAGAGSAATPVPPEPAPGLAQHHDATAASVGVHHPGNDALSSLHADPSQVGASNAVSNSIFANAAAAAAAAAASQVIAPASRKSTKATWSTADDLELIRQLRLQREHHEHAHKATGGASSILGNRGITWSVVEAGMEKYRLEKGSSEGKYDALACRNRWQLLMLQYRVVADIRSQPGFVWSDTEGARMVPSHLWDSWINQLDTAHKVRIAKIFRLKGFPLFNQVASLAGDPAFLNQQHDGAGATNGPFGTGQAGSLKSGTSATQRARALPSGPNGQYNSPALGNNWSPNKRRNTGSGGLSGDESFTISDAANMTVSLAAPSPQQQQQQQPSQASPAPEPSAAAAPTLLADPNEHLIQQAQKRVRNESGVGLSIADKVTLTNLFRSDVTAVWTYMAIDDHEDEFRLAWLKEEVERVNSRNRAVASGADGGNGGGGGAHGHGHGAGAGLTTGLDDGSADLHHE